MRYWICSKRAPIGSIAFEEELLEENIMKLDTLIYKLSLLEYPHSGPSPTSVRKTLEELLGVPMLDHQWMQATLPVSAGGLVMRLTYEMLLWMSLL